ncbi:efflux RND transporter periplasmic adaptor subunit [Caulifigura coniformis]|nr:efflux RND transporter periplasmic adaptor subunit [Caulifigura coniformis]
MLRSIIISLSAAWLVFECAGQASAQPPASSVAELPKVNTVTPVKKGIAQKTEQPGRIEAFLSAPLYSKSSGYVQSVKVDIGDRVTGPKYDAIGTETSPGQPLVVISAPEVEEQLRQSEAKVLQAKADARQAEAAILVTRAVLRSATTQVDLARANTQKADADVKRWQSEYDRVTALAQSNAVTAKVTDEAEQQLRSAEAGRAAASAMIRSADAKVAEGEAGVAKAQADAEAVKARLAVAEAEQRQAAVMVGYLTLRAPFDGIVTSRTVDPGRLVHAPNTHQNMPLLTVVQATTVRLFVEVPESESILVENGGKATIKIPAIPGETFAGTVTRTAWSLESSNRTLKTEFDLPNEHQKFRPGMFAQVELTVAERKDAIVIPRAAVLTTAGTPSCLVVGTDGLIARREIQLGLRTPLEVQVISGLKIDDQVIASNASAFKEGQRVAIASKN